MMFKCPKCNKIFSRDLREKINKDRFINGKFNSYCEEIGDDTKSIKYDKLSTRKNKNKASRK